MTFQLWSSFSILNEKEKTGHKITQCWQKKMENKVSFGENFFLQRKKSVVVIIF